ncbi:unnamed protein product [Fraxinus pennsylvanica]|uniref:Uncharacterized protein n=1 Tax=Fraxinus pennsylvanica TaxID=56036 RepID=A0AAD2ED91_9LAMI|nr:unnamed protein product [Fraxinus pennsylvanica]
MENTNPNIARVQRVKKASSDQLLRKFAEAGSESNHKLSAKSESRMAKRAKRSTPLNTNVNASSVEINSLLPPSTSRKSLSFIPRLEMGKAKIRARELKNKSFMCTIEKTWRKTIAGASRVLMEKHYNRHKRLINDAY